MHENIFERLPRPDEVIKYERSFRNKTKIQQENQTYAYGCQSFIKCPERLTFLYCIMSNIPYRKIYYMGRYNIWCI